MAGYGRSKTANVLFAVEFDRRHSEGIRVTAVHPGGIRPELSRHVNKGDKEALIASIDTTNAAAGLTPFEYKSVPQGAETSVWAAAVADGDAVGGGYCEDCHAADMQEGEGRRGGVRPYALDPDRAQALWGLSDRLIGERF